MARKRRQWISQTAGSFHIISRTTGGDILLHDDEKEYFLELLECFSAGYFVAIHSFAILGNHFHVQATGLNLEAEKATAEELIRRYHLMFGNDKEPPTGSSSSGVFVPDPDGGIERLRNRLGSMSRFVQELKQNFTRWYNQKHDRKGYLWSDRFKGVIVDKGEAQLTVNAYVDLNPVRAGLVEIPENYRWCSLGLQVRDPERAKKLLTWTSDIPNPNSHSPNAQPPAPGSTKSTSSHEGKGGRLECRSFYS